MKFNERNGMKVSEDEWEKAWRWMNSLLPRRTLITINSINFHSVALLPVVVVLIYNHCSFIADYRYNIFMNESNWIEGTRTWMQWIRSGCNQCWSEMTRWIHWIWLNVVKSMEVKGGEAISECETTARELNGVTEIKVT